jgi:hypothetical protein
MKIDYTDFFIFSFLFMSITFILCIFEWKYYLDMISDIQGYKFNSFKNLNNNFSLKIIILFTLCFYIASLIVYSYIILPKKGYIEGFLFLCMFWAIWDGSYLFSFDKALTHINVLLFDIFIVGGICIVLTQYIFYNYYDILKDYLLLLFIFYLLTMLLFFYENYNYNKDLSNIKGISF